MDYANMTCSPELLYPIEEVSSEENNRDNHGSQSHHIHQKGS